MHSLRANFLTVFISSLVSFSFQTSLYSNEDPLWELNSSNFAQQVYGKKNAFIIEFYNSWCGHCIRFAPTWKELARETQTWKSVIDIGAVNCNDKENTALCRQYDVQVYPFIKFFWHHTNESEPGSVFTGNRDVPAMESGMIDFLESHWSEGVPSGWPELLPIGESQWKDVIQSIPEGKQSILIFVEHPDSFVGRKIILDLSFQKDQIVRRLLSSSDLVKKLKKIQSNETIPALLQITRDSKEELLLRFSKEDTESYIREKVFEQIMGESRNKTNTIEEKVKLPVKTVISDRVYMTDLENAVYISLNQEVGVSKYITGEKISALKAYLTVLKKYFPGSKPVRDFLSNLHSWVSYRKQSLTGAEFVQAMEKMQKEDVYLPQLREWVGCKGSDPKYRGYPCSLWTLFHTLTVQQNLKEDGDGHVLFIIRDYVQNFFTCEECATHFLKMSSDIEKDVVTSDQAVLWLWQAHNTVNRRLHGDVTEDPAHPKIQFPSAEACPQCRRDNAEWDPDRVLDYLRELYGQPERARKAQEAHDVLIMKQEDLTAALEAARNECGAQTDLILLRDRVRLLESTIESINADKRMLDSQLNESQEQLSANQIEISQLKLQLENEQQKVLELQREREAGATSELNALLQETRKDKELVEERALNLQEQLALSQREVNRHKDQLQQLQEENMVAKNNAHKQITDMEYRLQQVTSEKEQLAQEMSALDTAFEQLKLKCQHHLEDKRDLKATIGELQKAVNEKTTQLSQMQKDIEDLKKKHMSEVEEWNKFQADLLTAVRVANDFKTETLQDVEKLVIENKELTDKNTSLQAEIDSFKVKVDLPSPSFPKANLSELNVLSNVEKDLHAVSRRQLSTKRADRNANQNSVRSLIESIENATKQVKGQGPSSSCSSSSSSLNSITSDSRMASNAIAMNNNDNLLKPRTTTDSSSKDSKTVPELRLTKKPSSDSISASNAVQTPASTVSTKMESDTLKPLPSHTVSILSNKMDPMRRNSYGDIAEKKDPLSTLVKGGGSKRNALLKWCQNKTSGYKGIDITNFSSSWNDGLAFCALLHSYLPNLVPYDELDSKDKKRNFTLAFKAAESVGIPTTLNTVDLITQERPDWQSIMSYVTTIYIHFET